MGFAGPVGIKEAEIVEEIQDKENTVMEAYMASKIKLDGPVEFAMHVMALAPEDEEED